VENVGYRIQYQQPNVRFVIMTHMELLLLLLALLLWRSKPYLPQMCWNSLYIRPLPKDLTLKVHRLNLMHLDPKIECVLS